jgi:signal transduction histidine kinase
VTLFNAAAASLFGGADRLHARSIGELLPFVPAPSEDAVTMSWRGAIRAGERTVELDVVRTTLARGDAASLDVYLLHETSHQRELNRLREGLLARVASELREPSGALDTALELVATDYGMLGGQEFDQLVGSAGRTVRHLHDLLEDLMAAGAIEAGRFVVSPQPVELLTVINEAIESVAAAVLGRRQLIEHAIPGGEFRVLADRRYVRQALSKFLHNAARFSPEAARIYLAAEQQGDYIRVSVRDYGPGVPAQRAASLFRAWPAGEPGRRVEGLGLALARGIVEAHGGRVGFENAPDQGATFWLTLPVALASAAVGLAPPSASWDLRQWLACELHDRVAQSLTGMIMELDRFRREQTGRQGVLREIEQLQDSTRQVLHSIRRVLYDLHGQPNVEIAFVDGLRAQVLEPFQERTGISVRLSVAARWPERVQSYAALNIHRIVEAALHNVQLHSEASSVRISFGVSKDKGRITISDDGRGSATLADAQPGMGLVGMRLRTLLLGGELRISSNPGKGTSVQATVPVSRLV